MRTTTAREWPTLFTGAMIRALLDDDKTHTRRVVTRANSLLDGYAVGKERWADLDFTSPRIFVDGGPSPAGNPGPYLKVPDPSRGSVHRIYPRWQPGDLLWVRESVSILDGSPDIVLSESAGRPESEWPAMVTYRATDSCERIMTAPENWRERYDADHVQWQPSIHMPRWASRITLEITDMRAERVQEISAADCYAEGVRTIPSDQRYAFVPGTDHMQFGGNADDRYRRTYRDLWDSLNASRGFGWDVNPWVWVIQFKRVFANG